MLRTSFVSKLDSQVKLMVDCVIQANLDGYTPRVVHVVFVDVPEGVQSTPVMLDCVFTPHWPVIVVTRLTDFITISFHPLDCFIPRNLFPLRFW